MKCKIANFLNNHWEKIFFSVSILFVFWIYGFAVGVYRVFPYQTIKNATLAAKDWVNQDNYMQYLEIRPEKHIYPARQHGDKVTIFNAELAYNGYTFITSMWEDINGFKLIDMDGSELYNWKVSYNKFFPRSLYKEELISDWDVNIHGSVLFPNGDIVFNFHSYGLVKIDRQSNEIWKLKGRFHHSIDIDENGNLWVLDRETLYESEQSLYELIIPKYFEDFICKISKDGKILEKFSLLDIIYNSGLESLLFADGEEAVKMEELDFIHSNNIEILDAKYANHFPLFNTGDILISSRELNLIMIIDSKTFLIKWYMTGPFIRQHDPDYTENGYLTVFDNRTDNSDGSILGGSRILEIDPVSRRVEIIYKGDNQNNFYTEIAGNQQLLPNGNYLIAEYCAGKTFEITPDGQIVWNYINKYDEDEVYAITDAVRIPKNFITFIN